MPKKLTQETFIKKLKSLYSDKYDYSKVKYVDYLTAVCIICPKHGEIWKKPRDFISGIVCKTCRDGITSKKDSEQFIEAVSKVHNNKYDYSKLIYKGSNSKVCITCPIHGDFWQRATWHQQGGGCPKCGGVYKYTTEEWIEEAKRIHGDKYDYSKVVYKGSKSKVCVTCKEHGDFWQLPYHHIGRKQGCPKCNASKLETEIKDLLIENKFVFDEQKQFQWLGKKSLDFYLPKYNIAIECQGEQHFNKINFGSKKISGEESLKITTSRDEEKRKLCEENGVKILYFSDLHIDYPYEVIENKDLLIKKIYESSS